MPKSPPLDAANLWTLHYTFFTNVIAGVAEQIEALGVDAKELFLLAAVHDNPYPAELANACLMPKPTVTLYLKRLEGAGLVERAIDAEDLRRHKLTLTAAGKKVVQRGIGHIAAAYAERLSRLTNPEQAELARLIEKLA